MKRSWIRAGALAVCAGILVSAVALVSHRLPVSGYFAITEPKDVSPYRPFWWWSVSVALSVALTFGACAAVEIRRRADSVIRAILDVALPLSLLGSGVIVSEFVDATRSRETFECILASPLLVWAPAACAIAGTAVFMVWQRTGAQTKRA